MPKLEAQLHAINLAKEKLSNLDLNARCALVGLPDPKADSLDFRAFGKNFRLLLPGFDLLLADSSKPAKPGDHILVLHYLLCDMAVVPTSQLITFRDLPGGQFYWQPFLSRSINPLLSRIGNNLDLLTNNLKRFDVQDLKGGDFSARIHCIGKLYADLVYHLGDEEFGPAAEFLFDSCIRRIYNTEDAAYLASRICLELL